MIELTNVTKKFGDFTALDNVDLKIQKGTAFGLLGSNGAGKSTILRLLSGIYIQDGGEVTIDGEKVYDNVNVKQRVFFINDETVQYTAFTVESLKEYYRGYYPNFSEEIFNRLNGKIKLPLDKKLGDFSKGMKRQAIVIIALACNTDYILMDEAFDGLDPTMRLIIKQMIVDAMINRKLTTIISSHNLKEINEICDTAALVHDGKIVFCKELDDLKGNLHKIQLVFPSDEYGIPRIYTKEQMRELGLDVLHYEQKQSVCYVIIRGDVDAIRATFLVKKPIVFDIIPLTLEEIFIYELEVLGYDSKGLED